MRLSINNKNETIQLMKLIRAKTQRKTVYSGKVKRISLKVLNMKSMLVLGVGEAIEDFSDISNSFTGLVITNIC